MIQLRDYQMKGIEGIRASFRSGKMAPLYVLPTGGGKTFTFSFIAGNVSQKENRVLILVHRLRLLRQVSRSLISFNIQHGIIASGYTESDHLPVQVAMVNTMLKRLPKFKNDHFQVIITDEAHHCQKGNMWGRVNLYFRDAKKLGVTATPCGQDGSGLGKMSGGIFDDLIEGPTIKELIDRKFLVKPVCFCPKLNVDVSDVRRTKGDYDLQELSRRLNQAHIIGDVIAQYKKLCDGQPTVGFCCDIKHAEDTAKAFREAGYRAYAVHGNLNPAVCDKIIDGLADGSVQLVFSCDLIGEGVDIPEIRCVIMLRKTTSESLFIQMAGRALRTAERKENAIIIDHVGNIGFRTHDGFILNHGFPDDVREWRLEKESDRINKKGFIQRSKGVRQCEKCSAVHDYQPKCPVCGNVYEVYHYNVTQEQGELVEVNPNQEKDIKYYMAAEVARAKSLEELTTIGIRRGYKPGWARNVFNARQAKMNKFKNPNNS